MMHAGRRERHWCDAPPPVRRLARVAKSLVLAGVLMAAGTVAMSKPAVAEVDYSRFWPATVSGFALPASDALAEAALPLATGIETACTGGATEPFAAAFTEAVGAVARLSMLRVGALADENRLERIAFIPDGRGVVRRQVTRLIADRDQTALEAARLRDKSVALQGLTALEWVAFDKDGKVLLADSGEEGAYRCAYAAALAARLGDTATEVRDAFAAPSGQTALLLSPAPENGLAKTHKEAAGFVFNALMTSLELVRDQMLAPLVGEGAPASRVARVPFSRSHNGTAYLSGAIDGLSQAFSAAGFAQASEDAAWIGNTLGFERGNALKALEAVPADLQVALADKETGERLAYVLTILTGLRTTLGGELAAYLDFRGGFNALDGD